MKRRNICRVLSGMMAALLILANVNLVFAKKNKDSLSEQQNRYNVMFVTDESGSMEETDPEKLRYEAISRFVSLMAQKGNYLGSVAFDEKLGVQQDVQPIEGFEQKNNFLEEVKKGGTAPGWTNIGLGLKTAVDSLNKNRNQSLPSVIILLTDGNTDMEDEEKVQESLELKADAIEEARREGYNIYSICLNTDGSADAEELQQIAEATGGVFKEVNDSKDLADVETVFYKMIYGSGDSGANQVDLSDDGNASISFDVPEFGVEEINLILEGTYSNCTVTDASGYTFTEEEIKNQSMSGKDFSLIKFVDPIGGNWSATLTGDPGTKITYRFLYNSDVNIRCSYEPEKGYGVGDSITFHATICDSQGPVSDMSQYQKFSGKLLITRDGQEEEIEMSPGEEGFVGSYKIPDEGTFYAQIKVTDGSVESNSGSPYEFNVNNRSPQAPEKQPKAHANRWPFIGGIASMDLSKTAVDPDGDPLTYTIESTAFAPDDYSLDGNTLKVTGFSIPKGSFTIRATDPKGAYCTYDVLVTSTNIGLLMAIILCVGILLAIIILGTIVYKKRLIPFMGTITVGRYDNDGEGTMSPVSVTPGRGSVKLASLISAPDFSRKCKFQAGGKKKEIIFVSDKTVYSDISGPAKKIHIDGTGSEIRISTSEDMERGLIVTFRSIIY